MGHLHPWFFQISPNQKSVEISFADSEISPVTIAPTVTTKFNPFSQSYLTITNPNLFSLDSFSVFGLPLRNLLPLGSETFDIPRQSFFTSILPQNQNLTISFSYNGLPPQSIYIQNPYHFFNLFVVIISGLILLSLCAIILLRRK
jgi:hypothetical protein